MAADKTLNLWLASTLTERDALGTDDGLAIGDFCLMGGNNLYMATQVAAATSTWRPMAGLPTIGPYALGAKNTADSSNRTCYVMSAVTLRAVLDAPPTSITLAPSANLNWPAVPSVSLATATGFVLEGESASVAADTRAWTHGTYTVNF